MDNEDLDLRLEAWRAIHKKEIQQLTEDLSSEDVDAVFINGPVHSGKTSLAIATTRELQNRAMSEGGRPVSVFFTTPAIQETIGAMPVSDRTGIQFKKLPLVSQMAENLGINIIVIDETSSRTPTKEVWDKYTKLPNTKFIILSHPYSNTQESWTSMFDPKKRVSYSLNQAE